jgi:beta-galactosidase
MKPKLGTCYYPEHWPKDRWADDAARMVESGFSWVRIGEFCWSQLEPSPDQLHLEWLDEAIQILGQAGLQVILGTPTATPPRWMLDRHPDMLAVDAQGQPRKFGSRRHYCFSHKGYRQECQRIVAILAERYGQNPYVAVWQTDNEYSCHDTTLSYSANALEAFHHWLRDRYGDIAKLNKAWGNIFWSMEYNEFEQIECPNLTVTEPNPAHALAFHRFSSDQVVSFNRLQVDIIRKLSDAPIIHNYMGGITDFDHFKVGADLDIASWDSYPLGFLEDRVEATVEWKTQFMRQGDPDYQAFHHDLYRAVGRGRWWIMEQQPGPVNWAPYNPAPLPGMVRLWTWEAIAHGAEAVCYFRWRQAPFGQEQNHAGLLRTDNKSAPGLYEATQVAKEIEGLPDIETIQASVALIFDYESVWAWEIQPQGQSFKYFQLIFEHYQALRRLGLSIDILPPDTSDLSDYQLVLAPGLMHMNETLKSALNSYEGSVVLGPRFNSRDKEMKIPDPMPPNIPNLDCIVSRVESLRPGSLIHLRNGSTFKHWLDHLEGDAEVTLETQAGKAAVVVQDNLKYVAGWMDSTSLKKFLKEICIEQSIEICDLPDSVRIRDTASIRFYFNYGDEAFSIGEVSIPAAGVVWV